MWILIQVHTTLNNLQMQLLLSGRALQWQNEGEKSVNRAEGVPAVSVIPQNDLRLLQQAVQQEGLPQMPACFTG